MDYARADRFADEMTEHDWEHSLGGIHALAWDGDEFIGLITRIDLINHLRRAR